MKIVTTIKEVRSIVEEWTQAGKTVGFVPTMGYLHEGHASLMEQSVKENDYTVVSIFVNPTQFGPTEDLATYPRDEERDESLCESRGVSLIFRPTAEEMYSNPVVSVTVRELNETLCGEFRPTHFDGVCTVVTKLFNIVEPTRAYFGEKDAQQLTIIRKLVKDLNIPLEVIGCPIIREEDGLAKSSRNSYLSTEERRASVCLYRSISVGKNLITKEKNVALILQAMRQEIEQEPLAKIQYLEIVDADTLKPVSHVEGPVLVAMAVYMGRTRLIDNFSFAPNQEVLEHE